MPRVQVQSRIGNVLLAVLGITYAIGATALLVWFVIDVWRAASFADRLLQAALIVAAICGAWFVDVALKNLRRVGAAPWETRRSPGAH